MSEEHKRLLDEIYIKAELTQPIESILSNKAIDGIKLIADRSDDFLGILNVVITSLTEKSINPQQDIRKHQAKMLGGYSGRTLDTKIIAPWLKSKKLPSMKESGWLTRSLEQDAPYDLDYKGAIRDSEVKQAFLHLLDYIQKNPTHSAECLEYLLRILITARETKNKFKINPIKTISNTSIEKIILLLKSHFKQTTQRGKARLPVLAMYSIYEIIMQEMSRYQGKVIKALNSHTSSDFRSGDIGDIQINNENGYPYEGLEIKYGKIIDSILVKDIFEKIQAHPVERYYILSTEEIDDELELEKVNEVIANVHDIHGCQIIVNGLISSIQYYLRLIHDPDLFLEKYTFNVLNDPAIKHEHKEIWKQLIEKIV